MEIDDLIQEGQIGLMRAVAKFDPDHGKSFHAYATAFVYYGVLRAIDNQEHLIRVPAGSAESLRRFQSAQREALLSTGCPLSEQQLAKQLELSIQEVRRLSGITQLRDIGPIEAAEGDCGANLDWQPPLKDLSERILQRDVSRALAQLSPLEERLLRMRFGIPFGVSRSLNGICVCLGISREKAGLVESKALRRLRHSRAASGLRSFLT